MVIIALLKFEFEGGGTPFVWEEFPSLPSDQAELTIPRNHETFYAEHKRNGVFIARKALVSKGIFEFFFKNVSTAMVTNFKVYAQEDQIRFFPDSALGAYFDVYWISKWRVKLQRGGSYNFSITLLEV